MSNLLFPGHNRLSSLAFNLKEDVMNTLSVSQFFGQDHAQLKAYFVKFQELKTVNYPQAKENFKHFKFGLQRHIIWQEEFLFPLFEKLTGLKSQPFHNAHRSLEDALDLLHKKVQKSDPNSDEQEKVLLDIYDANGKEEEQLYETIDQKVSPLELVTLFKQMQDVPAERYKVCCNHHVHF
jgi:regulator of cell morphogenesis and NO signaling